MFRLRKVLGDDVLSSRPYRLLLDVTSDVDRLRQLLARGAVLKALDLFRGPPLPGSEAPGVVSLRAELLAELRAAVLASRSAAALERWTATDEGHDDAAGLAGSRDGVAVRIAQAGHGQGAPRAARNLVATSGYLGSTHRLDDEPTGSTVSRTS